MAESGGKMGAEEEENVVAGGVWGGVLLISPFMAPQ